jgi:hypothetical protein
MHSPAAGECRRVVRPSERRGHVGQVGVSEAKLPDYHKAETEKYGHTLLKVGPRRHRYYQSKLAFCKAIQLNCRANKCPVDDPRYSS